LVPGEELQAVIDLFQQMAVDSDEQTSKIIQYFQTKRAAQANKEHKATLIRYKDTTGWIAKRFGAIAKQNKGLNP